MKGKILSKEKGNVCYDPGTIPFCLLYMTLKDVVFAHVAFQMNILQIEKDQ